MPDSRPDFSVHVHATTHTIDLEGDLGEDAAEWVTIAVEGLAERSPRCIVLNSAGVHDVDAGGLDQLVTLAEEALRDGSRLVISHPSPVLREKLISGGCAALLADPDRRSRFS